MTRKNKTKRINLDDWDQDFWNRSASEPDLSENNPHFDRWSKVIYPFEYIAVDDLKFFRRGKPRGKFADLHTRSSVCLYDKNQPELPFSAIKSEYSRRYRQPQSVLRPSLTRKSTTLRLDGQMLAESEHKSKYLPYPENELLSGRKQPIQHKWVNAREQVNCTEPLLATRLTFLEPFAPLLATTLLPAIKSKPSQLRKPENLVLSGDLELMPEYKSAFVTHSMPVKKNRSTSKEASRAEGLFDETTDQAKPVPSSEKQNVKCHLKLEGEMTCVPEYKSQYIQFPIEKSHSIPQLSHIEFQGNFVGVPEYRESFKFYDKYSKSAPIKKEDHIHFNGKVNEVPEYKEKFREPDQNAIVKSTSLKTDDHLEKTGGIGKDIPEYFESYKDPKVTEKPEKGKCREPYLRLKGKIEFDPEYRSTYLNYPRSRPITKKSTSSIKISNAAQTDQQHLQSPKKKFLPDPRTRYHDPTFTLLPLSCQPEYRKAKREFLIKERPLTRKATEIDFVPKTVVKSVAEPKYIHQAKQILEKDKKKSPRKRGTSPKFKVTSENTNDLGGNLQKASPKFGRRASLARNSRNRVKTNIIEGNPKYVKDAEDFARNYHQSRKSKHDASFVILDDPPRTHRQSAWTKKHWYET